MSVPEIMSLDELGETGADVWIADGALHVEPLDDETEDAQ